MRDEGKLFQVTSDRKSFYTTFKQVLFDRTSRQPSKTDKPEEVFVGAVK